MRCDKLATALDINRQDRPIVRALACSGRGGVPRLLRSAQMLLGLRRFDVAGVRWDA